MFRFRRFTRDLFFYALSATILIAISSTAAVAQCQWGNYNGAYKCRCPDGSFANYVNGQIVCPDQGVHCGGGRYCQHGTTCCLSHNQCCSAGNVCSNAGCVPIGADVCSNGTWCNPGHKCWIFSGQMKCITVQEAHAREHGSNILKWLRDNKARMDHNFEERNKIAWQYVLDNEVFQSSLRDLLASKVSSSLYGEKYANIMMNLKSIAENGNEFRKGNYYEWTLGMTNQVSSILLDAIPTYGGPSPDMLNVAGSFTTAYVYGSFGAARHNDPLPSDHESLPEN